ncbi:MAG: hypothetical protein ACOYJH_01800 [Anaerovoracaceae bacterium]|jgi:hypothetical protein
MSKKERTIYLIGGLIIILFFAVSYYNMNIKQAQQERLEDTAHVDVVGTWQAYDYITENKKHDFSAYLKQKNLKGEGYVIKCRKNGVATCTFTDRDKGEYEYSGEWKYVKKKKYYLVAAGSLRFKMKKYDDGQLYSNSTLNKDDGDTVLWKKVN